MSTLDLIDLFCGAGGMSLGFQMAGLNPIYAIDIDKYSIDTYRANFGDHAICGDIRAVETSPKPAVVIDGPPCQGFSRLGKQSSKARPENLLRRECMRCVEIDEPTLFVIENMGDFFKDPAFEGVQTKAAKLGYSLVHGVLNAVDYGVPQKRMRVFMVGSRIGKPSLPPSTHRSPGLTLFSSQPLWRTVRDAIGDLPLKPNKYRPPQFPERRPVGLGALQAHPACRQPKEPSEASPARVLDKQGSLKRR